MPERLTVRLATTDQANLLTIARALETPEASRNAPWKPNATIAGCLRIALQVTADAARRGELAIITATDHHSL